jgi:hypothetical protein
MLGALSMGSPTNRAFLDEAANRTVGKWHHPGLLSRGRCRCLPQPRWQGRPRSLAADRRFARE